MTPVDRPFPMDPLLFHPIVRILCCCQNFQDVGEARDDNDVEDAAMMINKLVFDRLVIFRVKYLILLLTLVLLWNGARV